MLTWKQNLKHLSSKEYDLLREMCHLSKNVYNEALYNIRQHFFAEGEYLRYEANYWRMKDSENYKFLGANVAQQTMRCVDASFKSFFALLDGIKKNKFSIAKVNLPKYLNKDGLYPLHLPQASINKEGYFLISMSPELKKITTTRIKVKVPPQIVDKRIRQIHIIPKYNGKYFEVRYMFDEDEVKKPELDYSKALAIDLGVNNFATCATSDGGAFIIDGKYLKSLNQWYNKELARLSSIKDHQRINKRWTKRLYLLAGKRDRRIQDYIYCSAKYIVKYCIDRKIGNIVCGYNDGFQDKINLGKVNNQNFVMLPFGKFKHRLEYLCETYGIKFIKQEESYTSQASFFDNDEMPIWNADNPAQGQFSGKRIKRGLYKTANGQLLNADVNGALNILRKSKLNDVDLNVKQCRGEVITPLRIICVPQKNINSYEKFIET